MKFKKLLILSLAAILLLSNLMGCSCKKQEETPNVTDPPVSVVTPEPDASATPAPATVENTIPAMDGSVVAGDGVTYGIASNGTVRFIGQATTGQNNIYGWSNVVRLVTNSSTVAALTSDGTILLAGAQEDDFAPALELENVADIAMGSGHIAVLHKDGTVSAVGASLCGQCDVSEWKLVTAVAAAGDATFAISQGRLLSTVSPTYADAFAEYEIAAVAAAADHIALLLTNGSVITASYYASSNGAKDTPAPDATRGAGSIGGIDDSTEGDTGWRNIVRVFVGAGSTYGVDSEGNLFGIGSIEFTMDYQIKTQDVYCVAAASDHVVVLYGDGTAAGYGDNTLLQCSVSAWRLLPYVSDGYLLGHFAGDTIDGTLFATGVETTFTEPATGEAMSAVCVLLGDVNGDGAIDEDDVALIEKHISGEQELTGAFLRAANIIIDDTDPTAVDIVDIEEVRAQQAGKRVIDQYAKTSMYTTPLADARRVNTDALGYITIPGTNISYPIMYGQDWYYNERGLDKEPLTRGSIYYYWSKAGKNIVFTGHNARSTGTMFHELHIIQDNEQQLLEYANRVWCINSYGVTGYWEIWSIYEEDVGSGREWESSQLYNTCWPNKMEAMNQQEQEEWIQYQLDRSEVDIGAYVTTSDRFMTIVTCSDSHADAQNGARLYIFLRWVGND